MTNKEETIMNKQAYEASVRMVLDKHAGVGSEETGRYIGRAVGRAIGIPLTELGAIAGYFEKPRGRGEVEEYNDNHKAIGLIPGYSGYLNTRRTINTNAAFGDKSPRAREVANDTARAIVGLPFLYVPNLVGTIAAAISDRRTDEEQRKASTSSKWKYLIPGYATYDRYKTMGKSRELTKNKKEKSKDSKDKAKSKDSE